jgi:predicted acetyltransferase
MDDIFLVEPTAQYKEEYIEMINEWKKTGEKIVPFVLKMDYGDFDGMVKELIGYSRGIGITESYVEHTTYWLVHRDGKVLGAVNIRHRLNPNLLERGGHIGYGIRPSERRKGYATQLLYLALQKAKGMGLDKVLVTCDRGNVGSAKTITNNKGVLESEITEADENIVQRYWIDIF